MKIALVDDSKHFSDLVKAQISILNLKRRTDQYIEFYNFNDSEKFVELMQTEDVCQFDILILDIVMPKLNGFEVRRKLKELCPSLKCFLISADIYKEEFFGEYQSIVCKNDFKIQWFIDNYKFVSRFMNNLEIDLYENDVPENMYAF